MALHISQEERAHSIDQQYDKSLVLLGRQVIPFPDTQGTHGLVQGSIDYPIQLLKRALAYHDHQVAQDGLQRPIRNAFVCETGIDLCRGKLQFDIQLSSRPINGLIE